MAEFPNQIEAMVPGSLTPSPHAITMTQSQVQTQQPIPPQQVQTTEVKPRHKYKNNLYRLGISEVVFGSISVTFGIVTLIIAAENPGYKVKRTSIRYDYSYIKYNHAYTWVGQGIWCGLLLIATGLVGIKAKNNSSVCMYNANMAMSIITANSMVPFMVLSGMAAGWAFEDRYTEHLVSLGSLHIILGIIGIAAAIVCIVHSAYCCAGVCCHRKPFNGPVIYTTQQYGTQQLQQMVRLADGQYMLVQVQAAFPEGYPAMTNPMVARQVVYDPPLGGVIVPQTTVPGQPHFVHPNTVYPPHGSDHPVPYPAATTQLARDACKDLAHVPETTPSYTHTPY